MELFKNPGLNILVDVGGSGVRIAPFSNGQIGTVRTCHIRSRQELYAEIRRTAGDRKIAGIAFSVAGFVDTRKGCVLRSANASYLEGDLAGDAKTALSVSKVRVVNDGEAHARTLLLQDHVKFGAIHLALGTSVAFGVIGENGQVLQTASGENWDIGDMTMTTRSEHKEVWYLLGTHGLKELEDSGSENPYFHFGCRLGTLLTQLAVIFRPRTIGLSGGIVTAHAADLKRGILTDFHAPVCSEHPDIRLLTETNTVMLGLTTLL